MNVWKCKLFLCILYNNQNNKGRKLQIVTNLVIEINGEK